MTDDLHDGNQKSKTPNWVGEFSADLILGRHVLKKKGSASCIYTGVEVDEEKKRLEFLRSLFGWAQRMTSFFFYGCSQGQAASFFYAFCNVG